MADATVRSARGRVLRYVVVVLVLAMSLAYVVLTFDWRAIGAALANANLVLLIVGGCSTILAYFAVRAARWAVVLRGSGLRLPFGALYRWSVFSQAAIIVTPFQSGEMVKIELMRSAGLGTRIEGYGGLVVERAADVGVLIAIAAVAVLANLDRLFAFASAVWVVAALGAVGVAVLLLVARRRLGFLTDLARSASDVARHPGVLVAVVGLTFVAWSIVALGWLLCFRSVGVVVSYTGHDGSDVSGAEYKHGELVKKGERGVWNEPLLPGKYAFNTYAGKVITVPTTNFILKWTKGETGFHRFDENLSEVSLITKDAFEPSLPLSVVVHNDYRKAPLVVQRFGDVKRLVEQTLDPMVAAYFKNIAQTRTLIQLLQERSLIQAISSEEMKARFGHYNLELEEVLIGTPTAAQGDKHIATILEQLRSRQIAEEQIETYARHDPLPV